MILFITRVFSDIGGHQKAVKRGLWKHEFCFNSDYYTPFGDFYIPTGEIANVDSAPIFDFRKPKVLGDVLSKCPNEVMDASFCVNNTFAAKDGYSQMR